ncbi:hypothetical protein SLA2020_259930 [Shorea laevis]
MLLHLLSSISIFLNLFLLHCYATTYNITSSNPLSQNEILISPAQDFELGLFHPDNSTNQYVGIWYKNIAPRTFVWVANRENPVIDSLACLKIGSGGNLKLVDGNGVTLWSNNVSNRSNGSVAVLLDNGNFVLQDFLSRQQLWQSFEHQVNTFLPCAGIGYDLETGERHVLSSCKSNSDQSHGILSLKLYHGHHHKLLFGMDQCLIGEAGSGINYSLLAYQVWIQHIQEQLALY